MTLVGGWTWLSGDVVKRSCEPQTPYGSEPGYSTQTPSRRRRWCRCIIFWMGRREERPAEHLEQKCTLKPHAVRLNLQGMGRRAGSGALV